MFVNQYKNDKMESHVVYISKVGIQYSCSTDKNENGVTIRNILCYLYTIIRSY